MDRFLIFNGKSSASFSMFISGTRTYGSAQKDYEAIEVMGLNGDLLIDNNRYKNIEVVYECFIKNNTIENLRALRNFLSYDFTYHRLEDTYDSDHYRLGFYAGNFEPNVVNMKSAKFELIFNCKPQRFLKNGEDSIAYTTNGTIFNDTLHVAKPIIRVFGVGTVGIGNTSIEVITKGNNYIDIDCELCRAYEGNNGVLFNRNANVKISDYKFPSLLVGVNEVRLTGVDKVEITPRWWEL